MFFKSAYDNFFEHSNGKSALKSNPRHPAYLSQSRLDTLDAKSKNSVESTNDIDNVQQQPMSAYSNINQTKVCIHSSLY